MHASAPTPQGNAGNPERAWALRPGTEGDLPFVTDSWRRSHEETARQDVGCPGGTPEYVAVQRQAIAQALLTSLLTVAADQETGRILGWVCHRPGVIHFVYVKPWARQGGVGRALLEHAAGNARTIYASHSLNRRGPGARGFTAVMERARAAGIHVRHNPALIFGGNP